MRGEEGEQRWTGARKRDGGEREVKEGKGEGCFKANQIIFHILYVDIYKQDYIHSAKCLIDWSVYVHT